MNRNNERPLTLADTEVLPTDVQRVGGKGVNLARLQETGQPVPPWYAVTTEAFHLALETKGLSPKIDNAVREILGAGEDALAGAADRIQRWIVDLELPREVDEAIARAHSRHLPDGAFAAIRSSATAEDATGDSFAGLHDSFLFVRGHDEIVSAVKRVWASAFNPRALAYRRARDLPLEEIAVGVVVQQMVDAESSGVMFTANPNNGDVHEVVVSSLFGAGEGLVSVGLDADTFVIDKETLETTVEVAPKSEQMVFDRDSGGGLKRVPVPEELREERSLSEDRVRLVALAGLAIEKFFGRPQDIEFSFDESGRFFVLQARPVTTVEEYGPAAGNPLVWDNSNIIESYSGVTSPMTFSFIRHAYTIVYHCFSEVMGIKPDVVRSSRHTFENMLGLFRGQVYYNLRNWYALIRLFPGFNYNKAFMESMMGVRESARFDDTEPPPPGWRQRYFVELPALLRLVGRSTVNFIRIRRVVGEFEAHFKKHYQRWMSMDFSKMAPHDLMALYREMEEELLWNWKAPIINDFFVMIFYGTLKKLCVKWCGDESGSLQNDLICGEGGIESTAPTKMLLRLAREASAVPELKKLILEESPDTLAETIPADPRFAEFSAGVASYLEQYGFRCVNELKLEELSLKDRPGFLYQVIRNYLAMDDQRALDIASAEEREQGIRRDAEQRAFDAVGRGPRRRIFRWVLGNARLGVKNRENMRFARTRIYGLLRELLRAIGNRFAEEGILDRQDDIFFLTIDEVWDYIKGTAVTTDLRGLAGIRRREFEAYRSDTDATPDDRFETFGMAYHRNSFRARRTTAAASDDGSLKGIGCCPGVVTETVKVLRSPSDDARLGGEILVAERTDPGWVPLYPSVSGILIERGSILSHSAIVAREMGIPTIVGIPGLTAALATGMRVTMDGSEGTIHVLDGEDAETPTADPKPE